MPLLRGYLSSARRGLSDNYGDEMSASICGRCKGEICFGQSERKTLGYLCECPPLSFQETEILSLRITLNRIENVLARIEQRLQKSVCGEESSE